MTTISIPAAAARTRDDDYEAYLVGEISYAELMKREGRLITESALSRFFRLLSLGIRLPGRP